MISESKQKFCFFIMKQVSLPRKSGIWTFRLFESKIFLLWKHIYLEIWFLNPNKNSASLLWNKFPDRYVFKVEIFSTQKKVLIKKGAKKAEFGNIKTQDVLKSLVAEKRGSSVGVIVTKLQTRPATACNFVTKRRTGKEICYCIPISMLFFSIT